MAFTVTCQPGRHASATVRQVGPGWSSLVLQLDPGRVVIDMPPVSGGAALLAQFCRELSRAAIRIASDLDPDGAGATTDQAARSLADAVEVPTPAAVEAVRAGRGRR